MKVLFIIQGEGRGHLTQAVRLRHILEKKGHTVCKAFMGKSRQREIPPYAQEVFGNNLFFFNSPNFLHLKNKKGILIFRSFCYNLFKSPVYLNSICLLIKGIKKEKPDLIINFYDLTGGLAYFFLRDKIPYYAVSHHFFFDSPAFPTPDIYPFQRALLKLLNRLVAARTGTRLALSFDKQSDFKKVKIVPPLIRDDLFELKTDNYKREILVYLLQEGLIGDLIPIFEKHPKCFFSVFTGRFPQVLRLPDNVKVYALHHDYFREKLAECSGVITTSGFETVCEASYLKKPVFLIPSFRHYEQYGNCKDAFRTGLGRPVSSFHIDLLKEQHNEDFRAWCEKAEFLFLKTLGL